MEDDELRLSARFLRSGVYTRSCWERVFSRFLNEARLTVEENRSLRSKFAANQRALANLYLRSGRTADARAQYRRAFTLDHSLFSLSRLALSALPPVIARLAVTRKGGISHLVSGPASNIRASRGPVEERRCVEGASDRALDLCGHAAGAVARDLALSETQAMSRAFATIATKSYLAHVRALHASICEFHDYPLYVAFADDIEGFVDPAQEKFITLRLQDYFDDANAAMTFYYTPFELCTALRPFLHAFLLKHTDVDTWIFLDSDIQVLAPLDDLFARLDK